MSVGGVVLRLALVGLLVVLLGLERDLADARAARRDTSNRIGRLIPAEERERLEVAALAVEAGDGRAFTYVRAPDGWRCPEYHGALAASAAVDGLIERLLEAEGVARDDDVARRSDYGLGVEDSWTVRLLGPDHATATDRDERLAVELGAVVPGEVGAFVRRSDHPAVWALDSNPREFLDPPPPPSGPFGPASVASGSTSSRPGLPPLLDLHVVPAAWPGGRTRRAARVDVVRDDGVVYSLRMDRREVTQDELMAGVSPYVWTLVEDGAERPTTLLRAANYAAFLLRVPWTAVRPGEELAAAGLDRARAQVTLYPADETLAPCALFVGRPRADAPDLVPVYNTATRMLFDVPAPVAELLAPAVEPLVAEPTTPTDPDNPWTPWLR